MRRVGGTASTTGDWRCHCHCEMPWARSHALLSLVPAPMAVVVLRPAVAVVAILATVAALVLAT